ncbi:MAG TPA: 3-phosphoshikimate 1-carboxyvinyltransferase [Candidatus Limnocylindrales bacterium]|nr:3-phosphoshikimate 1-carboxyvinyltransferase [Candidatus Limnocylindrales bacterium]
MVDVIVKKAERLTGEVCAPASKSYTQRMLIAAALSNGTGKISNPLLSEDTEATLRAITALGAETNFEENCWSIKGAVPPRNAKEPVDCGESGATLRFMIPIAALAADPSILVFRGSLDRRPIGPLIKSLDDLGATVRRKKLNGRDAVFVGGGGILGGKTSIRGDVSSQFISGLMFACPIAKVDTEIILTKPLESADYVKMTWDVLQKHGVRVDIYGNFERIQIPANQTYKPCDCRVPGDFSSAAFLLSAAAITNSKVKVNDLDYESVQGDKAILGILKQMGVAGKVCENSVEIDGTGTSLEALNVDAKNTPDLVPVCAALACFAQGVSKITGTKRLRLKESDRLASLCAELGKMGAKVQKGPRSLTVTGAARLHGALVDPHNDHRVAMACAVAALGAEGQTTIQDAECVRKSYPQFFTHLKLLGAEVVGG